MVEPRAFASEQPPKVHIELLREQQKTIEAAAERQAGLPSSIGPQSHPAGCRGINFGSS
jgi:hypothetical protein